ncbi:hypothetical protein [Brevundimonas sp.]|uniref:hypothetical protein n=1 Tax=Brevundimonas sp. TaxID=1871086 RepID=UPI00391D9979
MLDSFLNRNVESRAYQPTTSLRHIVRNQLMSEHHLDNNKYLVVRALRPMRLQRR